MVLSGTVNRRTRLKVGELPADSESSKRTVTMTVVEHWFDVRMSVKNSNGLDSLVGGITNSDLTRLLTRTSVKYTRDEGQQIDYRGSYTHPFQPEDIDNPCRCHGVVDRVVINQCSMGKNSL